jgi:ABC-type Mn2+/Zn2+ transport system ATPase subunit
MHLLEFKNVSLGYGRTTVLAGISFSILKNDFLGIVGPNGAGKTTLVRAILGMLRPEAGSIARASDSGTGLRMGYVPQRDTLDSILSFTVRDVVMMGRYQALGPIRRPGKTDRRHVDAALTHVDLLDKADAIFMELSGGQKQRALIARALSAEPDLLVLDEPTNGMDISSRTATLDLVQRLHREQGLTVIMVSHLLTDVANYVRRIALVERSFFQIGSTEEILTARNLSQLYSLPVHVERVRGCTVVIAGDRHD